MSLLQSKIARRGAVGVAVVALVAAGAIPTTVGAQVVLRRACGNDGNNSTTNCTATSQNAVPIAAQQANNRADADAKAASLQANLLGQDADNSNKGAAFNALEQVQVTSQEGGDQDLNQDVDSNASTSASGGNAVAVGHSAKLDFDVVQANDASVNGDNEANSDTGDANSVAVGSGDSEANGGNGNGNSIAASLAAQLRSGNARSSTDADAGDGGNADVDGGNADADGGEGGDGGNANSGLNGNGATAASIAAQLSSARGSGEEDSASGEAESGNASKAAAMRSPVATRRMRSRPAAWRRAHSPSTSRSRATRSRRVATPPTTARRRRTRW
jgi:hypothetical protein